MLVGRPESWFSSFPSQPVYTLCVTSLRKQTLLVALIWFLFLIRLSFYAAVTPMWEGLDEWAHFSYVDHLRQTGTSPSKETPVSGEVAASLRLVPLPAHLVEALGSGISHEDYWRLPELERSERERALKELRLSEQAASGDPGLQLSGPAPSSRLSLHAVCG